MSCRNKVCDVLLFLAQAVICTAALGFYLRWCDDIACKQDSELVVRVFEFATTHERFPSCIGELSKFIEDRDGVDAAKRVSHHVAKNFTFSGVNLSDFASGGKNGDFLCCVKPFIWNPKVNYRQAFVNRLLLRLLNQPLEREKSIE